VITSKPTRLFSLSYAYKKRNNKCITFEGLRILLQPKSISKPLNGQSEVSVKPQRKEKDIKENKIKEEKTNEYKNILLSKINISDFPQVKKEYFEIAKGFQELFKLNLIEANSPTKVIDNAKGSWIDDIRLMIESDNVTIEDMREIFHFLKKDVFWKQNILSTKKLREQFPKLKLKIYAGKNATEPATSKKGGNRITDEYKANILRRMLD